MAIKIYRPTTPGQRFKTRVKEKAFSKRKPLKAKIRHFPKKVGRSKGKISVRHQGGGHKRLYRDIDFKRTKRGIAAKIVAVEYDPNRSANIALIHYDDGEKGYILAPQGVEIGDKIMAGEEAEIKVGNALPLKKIPLGSTIHNIELKPGKGGILVRTAGQYATLMSREEKLAQLKLPSGEIRLVPEACYATLGQVGNVEWSHIRWGKAGAARHRGRRPAVRGTAMPAGEHPHGGGEGRTGTGRPPKTVYGRPARGKTRKKGKKSDRYIVKRRR